MENDNANIINRCRFLVMCIGILTMLVSLSVMIGTYYHITLLTSISPNWVNMKINTAISFLLTGMALLLINKKNPSRVHTIFFTIISTTLLLINVATLIEFLFGVDFGIDQLILKDIGPLFPATTAPGRMALITAINFTLVAITFFLALKKSVSIWVMQTTTWLILLIAFLALCNYIYFSDMSYPLVKYTTMAMNTCLLFLLVGVGILLLRPTEGILEIFLKKSTGGYLLRCLIPILIVVPISIDIITHYFQRHSLLDPNFGDVLMVIVTIVVIGLFVLIMAKIIDQKEKDIAIVETENQRNQIYAAKQLQDIAQHDLLTGLLNRSELEVNLDKLIADKKTISIAVIVLDIDRFKLINEAFGHDHGDMLLKTVALRLRGLHHYKEMNLSRLGGDKFIFYLADVSRKEAYDFARIIQNRLSEPFALAEGSLALTASIGIALYPQNGLDSSTLVVNADLALNEAKRYGGNRIYVFVNELEVVASKTIAMDTELRSAMLDNQFTLRYQPQVDLTTGEICAAEVLVRWQHPVDGLTSPNAFIPFAEKNNLIIELNEQIIRMTFQKISDAGSGIPFSINISAQQFQEGFHLVDYLELLMKEFSVNAKHIELEITENILIQDTEHNIAVLTALSQLGFQIAIDDFGIGFSSFGYIKRLPVHKIKIDKSFITGLPDDITNAKIVKAIISMAHALDKIVVAEGVETKAEVDFLKEIKCDIVQGFYYYKPMSFDELTELTKK